MRLTLSTTLDCSAGDAIRAVQASRLMAHVAAPLLHFEPLHPPALPETWQPGEYLVRLKLFGRLPLGRQWIVIRPESGDQPYVLRDQGRGDGIATWDHQIFIQPVGAGKSRYTDRLTIAAGWRTPFVALFAALLFRHRQMRWRALAQRGVGKMLEPSAANSSNPGDAK